MSVASKNRLAMAFVAGFALLGSCHGNRWQRDFATCPVLSLSNPVGGVTVVDGYLHISSMFGETQAYIWAEQAAALLRQGETRRHISEVLSGPQWRIEFLDADVILIVYYGSVESSDGGRVWIVDLD